MTPGYDVHRRRCEEEVVRVALLPCWRKLVLWQLGKTVANCGQQVAVGGGQDVLEAIGRHVGR
jgi:hypothetical protein